MKTTAKKILESCEAFLFDKDGTLIDFNAIWVKWSVAAAQFISGTLNQVTEKEVLAQWGVDALKEIIDPEGPMAVGSLDDIIVSAAGLIYRNSGFWPESRQLVCDAVAAAYDSVSKKDNTRAIAGIPSMIRHLKNKGYKLGVVTTDDTESALEDLQVIGLADSFNVVLGCDKVKNCKPAPDLVMEACRIMEVKPEKTAVIGDTRADMLMGRRGGVSFCIGVTSGVSGSEKLTEIADLVLPSAAFLIK